MATNISASTLQGVSQTVSTLADALPNGADHSRPALHEEDDRSSSLSEIGERVDQDRPDIAFSDGSDENDTEAETERLEDSPQKLRTHQNLVIKSTDGIHGDRPSVFIPPDLRVMDESQADVDLVERTSDLSSFADSGEEDARMSSVRPPMVRKRKRSGFEPENTSDLDLPTEPSPKATKTSRDTSTGQVVQDPSLSDFAEEDEHKAITDTGDLLIHESRLQESPESTIPLVRYHKGRRKGRKIRGPNIDIKDTEALGIGSYANNEDDQEDIYSNEEDCENDDIRNAPEPDQETKHEEGVVQKNSALDSLNAMEKYFATFRDKLFEERLSQMNAELSMLESARPMHPELKAMKNVIDQRRDQKLRYEQNLMQYKLQTLQRESVAKKAQAHSQYMQAVREIRDSSLDRLNQQFYQLQKERRGAEGDVPDYLYEFSSKRSQWIAHQTAYNAEVSILSGMAKYVGFPAAPDISKAKRKEIEDDLRSMGISTNVPPTSHNHLPGLRTMSTNSNTPRPKKGADEHFLEQNPWANPQHPSHHQRRILHRQMSGLSRATTPMSASANQIRIADPIKPQAATSAVSGQPPEQNSSLAAPPVTDAPLESVQVQNNRHYAVNNSIPDSTPSKTAGSSALATRAHSAPFEFLGERGKDAQPSRIDPPPLIINPSQDDQTPKYLPKPLPFSYTGSGPSSAPGPRTSNPSQYNVAEAENQGYLAQQSPLPQYHTVYAKPAANGVMNRFAT